MLMSELNGSKKKGFEFLTLVNVYNEKCFFVFLHLTEFTELTFFKMFLASFASQRVLNKDPSV
jgi:hypothetical protein